MGYEFRLTRDRSTVNSKYSSSFIGNGQKAVAPVLQRYKTGEYRIIGTCSFFISPNLFITAAHIFEGDDINDDDGFSVFLDETCELVPIVNLYKYEHADLAIFTIDAAANDYLSQVNPLAVMSSPLGLGEVVALFGFSHSDVDPSNTEETADGDVYQSMSFRPKWELGGVLEVHESGCRLVRGNVLKPAY